MRWSPAPNPGHPADGTSEGGRAASGDEALPSVAPTSEAQWHDVVTSRPELHLAAGPVVAAAPHPDDETLAVGGLLAHLAAMGCAVDVVAVTDGEASHPGLDGLAAERVAEQIAALAALGIDAPTHRLGLPDGGVADHVDAVTAALVAACTPDTTMLAPWAHDGHCDHDAVGRAAQRAAELTGARLLGYLVWAWQWADPQALTALPLRHFGLSPALQAAKADAVACFTSQTGGRHPPILPPEVLERFARPCEVVVDDPR